MRAPETASANSRFDPRLAAILVGVVALVYLPSLFNGFVWDDDRFLTANPLIHAPDGLFRFWFSAEAPDYFPLTSTTLWVEWRLWGKWAAGYHAVNVLLHAVSCVLLWRVFARLGCRAAFLGAAIFALHPVAVESVAWITERKNTLCFFFAALATLLFLRAEDDASPRARALALAAFVASLLAKTATATLPISLLAFAFLRNGRLGRHDLLRTAPFFAASLALGLVTVWFQYSVNIADEVVRTDSLARRAQIAGWAVWFYLWKALIPVGLSFVYGETAPLGRIVGWVPALLLVPAFAAAWKCGRGAAVACVHFAALLLPVLGFLDIYFMRYAPVSDHWAFFALPAVCIVVAEALARAAAANPPAFRAVGATLCMVLAFLSVREQSQYRDEETLWRATIERNPRAWIALNNLGRIEYERGNAEAAEAHWRAAVRAWPDYREAHYNLGNALRDAGRTQEALRHYAEAVRIDPEFARAWNNAGNVLLAAGRTAEAIEHLGKAAELQPNDPSAVANLAAASFAAGDSAAAERLYLRAIGFDARHVAALNGLGIVHASRSEYAEAANLFAQAVAVEPANVEARFNLASALDLGGDAEAAIPHYREALRLAPGDERIAGFLAEALETVGAKSQ